MAETATTTSDDTFLADLTAALTSLGWNANPVIHRDPARERLAKYSSPEDDLRVAIRSHPAPVIADLVGTSWRADLTSAGSITAALAAIEAAHAWIQQPETDEHNRSVQQLLHEAGWTSSLDAHTPLGDEPTWYSPDGSRRLRTSLEHPPARGWILALAPDFTENRTWTGNDSTPDAVIAALALTL